MDRIVYCPSEKEIDEAMKIAEQWALPIQIGDSEKTKSLEFDRTKSGVVMVPISNGFMINIDEEVNHAFPIPFDYFNDFEDVTYFKLKVTKDGSECVSSSFLRDKHSIIGSFIPEMSGEFLIEVFHGGKLIDSSLVFIP